MWISELFYANSIAATKFAALLFYYKMFRFTAIRIPIYVLFVTITIWIILRTFLVIFQCVPVEAIWDKTIPDPTCNIDTSKFFFGTVLTHCLMDIAIVLLPAFPVVKMQLPPAQKIAVIGLFACGTMCASRLIAVLASFCLQIDYRVCIASVFVLIESINYDPNSKEMPHDVALNFVWGGVETNLAVFSGENDLSPVLFEKQLTDPFIACLPLLRPVFRKIIPGLKTRSSDNQATSEASFAFRGFHA